MIERNASRLLAISFIVGSLIIGICTYLSFAPQFKGFGYGVVHFRIDGTALPVPVKRSGLGWAYLFVSIVFLIVSLQQLSLYLISPKDLDLDYEQYLYPSSTDEENRSDTL